MNKLLFLSLMICPLIAQERKDILEIFPQPIWQEILDYLPASEAFATYCLYVKKADSSPKIPLTSLQAEKFANVWDQKIKDKLLELRNIRTSKHMRAIELKPLVIMYLNKLTHAGCSLNSTSNASIAGQLEITGYSCLFLKVDNLQTEDYHSSVPQCITLYPSCKLNDALKLLFLFHDCQEEDSTKTLLNYKDYENEVKENFPTVYWGELLK